MEKRKLLTAVLFCFSIAGMVLADEVISIDLNNQGDANAYTGEAGVPGATVWRAFYEGWGKPMGSARTAGLADYDEPNKPGTYAAQVWIGVPDDGPFNYVSGSALMDDGFEKSGGPTDPNPAIYIIGEPDYGGKTSSSGAYSGTFDIYVYSSEPTWITLTSPAIGSSSKQVTDTYTGGSVIEPNNYVVFDDVVVNDGNNVVLGDANTVVVSWDNIINGLQLVKRKEPVALEGKPTSDPNGTVISAGDYDVAYETNARGADEISHFGPDIGAGEFDKEPVDRDGCIYYLETGEYMIYDITVDDVNQGEYEIHPEVATAWSDADMRIYLDDRLVGTVTHPHSDQNPKFYMADVPVYTNIFAGSHEVKWVVGSPMYFDVGSLKFYWVGDINMPDCDAVYKYGFNYTSDYEKDCRVDANDLKMIVDHWVECFDPNQDNCP